MGWEGGFKMFWRMKMNERVRKGFSTIIRELRSKQRDDTSDIRAIAKDPHKKKKRNFFQWTKMKSVDEFSNQHQQREFVLWEHTVKTTLA